VIPELLLALIPGLPLGLTPGLSLSLTPGLPFGLTPGLPFGSQPYNPFVFGPGPKARVATMVVHLNVLCPNMIDRVVSK
jgi:hypothetical protein